jgi:hypothetical protein
MLEPELVRWKDEQSSIARQTPKIHGSVAIISLLSVHYRVYLTIFTRNFYLI